MIPRFRAATHASDTTRPGAPNDLAETAVAQPGGLDVIINNEGICQFFPLKRVTRKILECHMDINFTAAFLLTQAASKQMLL